jgi:tetratricopeptide (TPR) repeat protein
LPILETLLKSEPGDADLRLYAGLAEADLGGFLGRSGARSESVVWLRRGLADLERLVQSDPANIVNLYEFITTQERLSLALARASQAAEAVALAGDAIARTRVLAGDRGATPESARELPRAYAAMAATYDALGKHEEARRWYRGASGEWEKVQVRGLYSPDSEGEIEEARKRGGGS